MTELTVFQQKISALIPEIEVKFDEPMAKHTSFKIGGGAEVMASTALVLERRSPSWAYCSWASRRAARRRR